MALKSPSAALTNANAVTLYTTPANTTAQVTYLAVCNVGSGSGTFSVQWLDASSSDAVRRVVLNRALPAAETLEMAGVGLEAGDALQVAGSAGSNFEVSVTLDES